LTSKNNGELDPDGLLRLNGSQVNGNTASGSSAAGGGISNQVGMARLTSSQVNSNTASATGAEGARGGGIENFQVLIPGAPLPSLTMTATLLSDNTVSTSGEVARGGGLFNSGSATVNFSILAGNRAAGSPAEGGGIFQVRTVTLSFSLVRGNIPDNCFPHGTIGGCTN
jgi:hypothetical protein